MAEIEILDRALREAGLYEAFIDLDAEDREVFEAYVLDADDYEHMQARVELMVESVLPVALGRQDGNHSDDKGITLP